jgi:glycosyltransferase involved in cell wall biosynthesis
MKIAFIDSEGTLGGAQRYLLDIAEGCAARRWDIVGLLGTAGPLLRAFRQRDFPILDAPSPTARPRWSQVLHLAELLHKQRVRGVYASTVADALLGSLAIRLIGGRAYWRVHRVSDIKAHPSSSRQAALRAHCVLTASPTINDAVSALVGQRVRTRLVPFAIDLARFAAQPPPVRKNRERPVIGMLGTWEAQSGQAVLVKAIRLLQQDGQAVRLRLASRGSSLGEERYISVVQGAVKAAGLADRIIIEGEVHDIPTFLARCDVIVAPSLYESTGRLALEAAAIGRPVIASRVAGLTEVVEDGHTGLLVPPNDPHALADALALALASPALRAEMGRQARIRAEERFPLNPLMEALSETFEGAWMGR